MAAVLWFVMFSPWTAPHVNFWLMMTLSALGLTTYAFWQGGRPQLKLNWRQVVIGMLLAVFLWGVFWVGDKVSQWLFGFARPQVDAIYAIREGMNPALIAALLLLIIGPAEELFWRGFIQKKMTAQWGANTGFVVATLCYTLIHIWSMNFMLVMSALACGVIWGGLYRLRPDWLPALIISHSLWDAAAFVVFPL